MLLCFIEQRKRESQGSDEETPSKLEKKKAKKDKKKSKEKEKEKEKESSDEVSMVDVLAVKMDSIQESFFSVVLVIIGVME